MKIRSKVTIGLLSSAMCMAALAHAAGGYKKTSDPDEKIAFRVKAIGQMMTINGSVPGLAVAHQEGKNLVFKAELHKLTTGMKPRDDHAKETLKVAAHPMAELKVKADSVSLGKDQKGTGMFTLGGKTKPLPFKYDAIKAGNKVKIKAMFQVNIKDYGIEPPCKLGVCVEEKTDVIVKFAMEES